MQDDRIASRYYQEVGQQPVLTAEQERRLFEQYENARDTGQHSKVARLKQQIACGHLKFVIQRAHHRTKNPETRLELIAEGNIGLMVAIDKFDLRRGNRFLTYAAPWIDVYMREFINRSLPVHMPNHRRKELRRRRSEEDRLIALGTLREHSEAEPAATSIENVAAASDSDVERDVLERQVNVLVYMHRAELTLRQRFAMTHYFGLRGGTAKSPIQVAALFYFVDGSVVSAADVRSILAVATRRLNEYLRSIGLRELNEVL